MKKNRKLFTFKQWRHLSKIIKMRQMNLNQKFKYQLSTFEWHEILLWTKNWVIFKKKKKNFGPGRWFIFIFFSLYFIFFFFRTENEANENKVKSRGNERVTVAVVSLMRRCIHQVAATATRISPSPQTKLPPLSRVPPGGLDLNGRGQWGTTESRGGGGGR